jgi:hypothetical protein
MSFGASCSLPPMIAPPTAHRKGFKRAAGALKRRRKRAAPDHELVKAPTITPYFGQLPVTLGVDNSTVASRPGPV